MDDYLSEKYGRSNYVIVKYIESSMGLFTQEVSSLIDDGYKPTGGISVQYNPNGRDYLMQAMVKK